MKGHAYRTAQRLQYPKIIKHVMGAARRCIRNPYIDQNRIDFFHIPVRYKDAHPCAIPESLIRIRTNLSETLLVCYAYVPESLLINCVNTALIPLYAATSIPAYIYSRYLIGPASAVTDCRVHTYEGFYCELRQQRLH